MRKTVLLGLFLMGCSAGDRNATHGAAETTTTGTNATTGDCGNGTAHKIASGKFTLRGVTSDGYAAVLEDNTAKIVSLASSDVEVIAANALDVVVIDRVVFVWSGADGTNTGALTVWSSLGGPRAVSMAALRPFSSLPSAFDDWILYYDAPSTSSDGTTTASLVLDQASVSNSRRLISLTPTTCAPRVSFAGGRVIAARCAGAAAPGAILSFDTATATPTTLLEPAKAAWRTNTARTEILAFSTSAQAVIVRPDGSNPSIIATDANTGRLTADGSAVVYTTTSGGLKRVPAAGGAATELVASGVNFLRAISPDGKRLTYSTQIDADTGLRDLYLSSAWHVDDPVTLNAAPTSEYIGDAFTKDSQFALYSTGLDAAFNGTLFAEAVHGCDPRQLATLSYRSIDLVGSRVLYNDHLVESEGKDGRADIYTVDLAAGPNTPPTLLATKAGALFDLTPDSKAVVYCFDDDPAHDGLYVQTLP